MIASELREREKEAKNATVDLSVDIALSAARYGYSQADSSAITIRSDISIRSPSTWPISLKSAQRLVYFINLGPMTQTTRELRIIYHSLVV